MTTPILLTQEQIALVSDEDSDLARHTWTAQKTPDGFIARNGKLLLHRVVLSRILSRDLARGELVSFADGDPLNCTRDNLSLLTRSDLVAAQPLRANNRSGYRGVSWNKQARRWQATLQHGGELRWVGYFLTPEEAASARQALKEKLNAEIGS